MRIVVVINGTIVIINTVCLRAKVNVNVRTFKCTSVNPRISNSLLLVLLRCCHRQVIADADGVGNGHCCWCYTVCSLDSHGCNHCWDYGWRHNRLCYLSRLLHAYYRLGWTQARHGSHHRHYMNSCFVVVVVR